MAPLSPLVSDIVTTMLKFRHTMAAEEKTYRLMELELP